MYKKLNRYCFIAFALVVVLLLSACSEKTISGKYVSMWDGILYYDFQNGNYTTGSGNSGTYIVDKDSLVLNSSNDNVISLGEYRLLDDGYLSIGISSGSIPNKELFTAAGTIDYFAGTHTFYFYDDGTFKEDFTAIYDELVGPETNDVMSGTYERKDEIITLISERGDSYNMLILDNILYNAYKKE